MMIKRNTIPTARSPTQRQLILQHQYRTQPRTPTLRPPTTPLAMESRSPIHRTHRQISTSQRCHHTPLRLPTSLKVPHTLPLNRTRVAQTLTFRRTLTRLEVKPKQAAIPTTPRTPTRQRTPHTLAHTNQKTPILTNIRMPSIHREMITPKKPTQKRNTNR